MTHHHHSEEPFDPDDPLTGMGIAMVGMALQEAAEEEERQRRSGSYPTEQPRDIQWGFVARVMAVIIVLIVLFIIFVAITYQR